MNPVFAKVYPPPRFSVVLPIMDDPRFKIISPGELDDYRDQAGDIGDASWPEFMMQADSVANENWHELFDRFSEYHFALLDIGQNRMAARGIACRFTGTSHSKTCPKAAGTGSFCRQSKTTRKV